MSTCGEPVDVWARDGRPTRFVWRGMLYSVVRVLEHWETAGNGEEGPREFWRAEAAPAGTPAAIYELRRDTATGSWLLALAWE